MRGVSQHEERAVDRIDELGEIGRCVLVDPHTDRACPCAGDLAVGDFRADERHVALHKGCRVSAQVEKHLAAVHIQQLMGALHMYGIDHALREHVDDARGERFDHVPCLARIQDPSQPRSEVVASPSGVRPVHHIYGMGDGGGFEKPHYFRLFNFSLLSLG